MSDETTNTPPPEDEAMTDRIWENGRRLVWQLYEGSAQRHIALQRRDPAARKLALLLNAPRHTDEMDACTAIAGGVFAERAACIATLRAVQGPLDTPTRDIIDVCIKAILARGPVDVAPEWDTTDRSDEPEPAEKTDAPAPPPTEPPPPAEPRAKKPKP